MTLQAGDIIHNVTSNLYFVLIEKLKKPLYSKQWKVFRQIQLSKHPICAGCKSNNIITPAQHVDHVFPWMQIGEHAFIHNIYQSLCQSCHSSKTQLEQRGIFKHYGVRDYNLSEYRVVVANRIET